MKLSEFKFNLPIQHIARYPLPNREDAKLMVVNKTTKEISHHIFSDIINFFTEDDLLVLNDTEIFPSCLQGHKEKTTTKIEMFLNRQIDKETNLWEATIKQARQTRKGNRIYFGDNLLVAEVIENTTSRGRIIKFISDENAETLQEVIKQIGIIALPEILKRQPEEIDKQRYQTVYAKTPGGTVAPDGGLHFTRYILKQLELKDVRTSYLTLNSNLSSLLPLEIQDLPRYVLPAEFFKLPQETAGLLNKAMKKKKKICAVGTPLLKVLESFSPHIDSISATEKWTNKFIYPPYEAKIVNALLTNFHPPRTIPFINTLALGGDKLIMKAYKTAIKENYRFSVYGDALLIV